MNPELAAESDADPEPYHRGWKMGITSVHVGRLPGRLNPCVYVQNGSLIEPLAYFRGHRADEMAYRLIALLDRIAKGIYVGEEPEHIDGGGSGE